MKLLLTSLFLSVSILASAQIVDKTEQKAKDKANKRVDKKIDEGIESGLDAIEGLFKKKKKNDTAEEPDENQVPKAFYGMQAGPPADVQDSYKFQHSVQMRAITYDKKGKESSNQLMKMYYSDDSQIFGMDITMESVESTTTIFDSGNGQMISLISTGGQKIGMVTTINMDKITESAGEDEPLDYRFVKTGNEKEISGYRCFEYLVESSEPKKDMVQKIWMAPDAEINWMTGFSNMSHSQKNKGSMPELPENLPEGSMIQICVEHADGRPNMTTTVESANKNVNKSISTSGYTMMNMGGNSPKN